MDLSVVPYGHISTRADADSPNLVEKNGLGEPGSRAGKIRYRECLRNHAASMGGHANDGCCEFMPGGEEPLKCAACGCHRNFHRKEAPGCADHPLLHPHHHPMVLYNAPWDKKMSGFVPQPHHHPMLPAVDLRAVHHHHHQQQQAENRRSETPEDRGGEGQGSSRKRFRTKFTQEQKEKMLAFAEKLGWRIQKQDDVALQQFCMEVGVKRHVLKVWMHNNKNTLGKKDPPPSITV